MDSSITYRRKYLRTHMDKNAHIYIIYLAYPFRSNQVEKPCGPEMYTRWRPGG